MRETFPGAAVAGYASLIEAMTNDPKDRHVLAAAVRANAEAIVTFNTSDFPEHALKDYEVNAVHPDDFLLDQLDLFPGVTLDVLHQQVAAYRHEPTTLPGLLVRLEGRMSRDSRPRYVGTSGSPATRHGQLRPRCWPCVAMWPTVSHRD